MIDRIVKIISGKEGWIKQPMEVSRKLTYEKDSLELYLSKYENHIESKNSWQISLSIFITLLIAVVTSTNNLLEYTKPFNLILFATLFLSGVAFIIQFYRFLVQKSPVKELRKELYSNYINEPDKNALFVIKRNKQGKDEILVYRDKTWGCYFLPYVKIYDEKNNIDYTKTRVANILDYERDDIEIQMLLEKHEISEKYHPDEKVVKEYHSYYYHLYASHTFIGDDITSKDSFIVGKRNFEWMELSKFESDAVTRDRNEDVLEMLRNHKSDFISNMSTFS